MITCSSSEILKLKECFSSLDDDMSGSIGVNEMKEPLIGLGFANTTKEVEHMIELVDEDGSGMIEFSEFLSIIRDSGENEKTKLLRDFFKDLAQGSLGSKDVSFPIFVCKTRRKHLLDAIYSKEEAKKN